MKLSEKIKELQTYMDKFEDVTELEKIIKKEHMSNLGFKYLCPKCEGTGKITKERNAIPSWANGGGMIYEPEYYEVECNLCDGKGYTSKEYKPQYEITGYR